MEINIYNPRQIVRIRVVDVLIEDRYKFSNGIKILGLNIKKRGFYSSCDNIALLSEPIEPEYILNNTGLFIMDDKVCCKSMVQVIFIDHNCMTKYFDSFTEALNYADDMKREYKFIELIEL